MSCTALAATVQHTQPCLNTLLRMAHTCEFLIPFTDDCFPGWPAPQRAVPPIHDPVPSHCAAPVDEGNQDLVPTLQVRFMAGLTNGTSDF